MTTHDGEEAAECCRLLTYLTIKLFHYKGNDPKKDVFDKLSEFETNCYSVKCLANSMQEKDLIVNQFN